MIPHRQATVATVKKKTLRQLIWPYKCAKQANRTCINHDENI